MLLIIAEVLFCYVLLVIGILKLWREHSYKERQAPVLIERKPDAWEGIDRARRKHPSPDAHSELKALEVDGPIHVHAPEHVLRVR